MTGTKTILLIVDDESAVCRALKRTLRGRVDEIVVAQTPADALTILESTPVTHVLCDHLLGPGQPRGTELVSDWKIRFPSISRILILTGVADQAGDAPDAVDRVLSKTTDPSHLAMHLQLSSR